MVISARRHHLARMDQALSPPYTITQPLGEAATPVVLSSPHSGRVYPRAVLDRLRVDGPTLLALDDGPIDKLMQPGCEAGGAVLVAARYPRVVVDLNREPDELDPDVVQNPDALAAELRVTARARAGLGVVPSRVGGQALWRGRLSAAELRQRLEGVFHPYHAALEALMRERRERMGVALLLDCHSMPGLVAAGEPAVDAALGDRFGRSCSAEVVAAAEAVLRGAGLRVARNRPYAGGYITGRHGRPEAGMHALQLELRRGLFMDEATHVPHAGFAALQHVLEELTATLAAAARRLAAPAPPQASPARREVRLAG
jgi:N-formylglutamate amidohydrolase